MTFDAQAIFANLTEKERIHGHHSPEGQAIRTLSRALHGWSSEILAAADIVVLCNQAIEDWLKAKLKVSAWTSADLDRLLTKATANNLLLRIDAVRLQRVHNLRARATVEAIADRHIEAALAGTIRIIEKHWL